MEIKYRVWCKDHNEWERDEIVLGSLGQIWHYSKRRELRLIRPEQHIVQIFTGLLDKSSKEIYEGDILLYTPPYSEIAESGVSGDIDVVIWKDGAFKFKNGDYLYELIYTDNKLDDVIIGNIFEHPELLCKHKNRSLAGRCLDCGDPSL